MLVSLIINFPKVYLVLALLPVHHIYYTFFIADFINFVFPIPDKAETMSRPDAACMASVFSNTLLGHCLITFRVSA